MSISTSVVKEAKEHILRILPVLLKKDKQFREKINLILSKISANENESQQILKEKQLSRKGSNCRLKR